MVLKFAGKTIAGTTEAFVYGGSPVQMRRVMYWGVTGEAEVVGRQGGRDILVTHIMHDGYEIYTDLRLAFAELNALLGSHGDLSLSTTVHGQQFRESLRFCTLEDIEKIPWPGQDEPQPLRDLAKTLFDANGDADEGWFQRVLLRFRQLRVN